MMTELIISELENTNKELLELISSFGQEQINTVPFEGSWTAAQLTEHLFKSDSSVLEALHSEGKQIERPPDQNVENLKSIFLNFNKKLSSPEIIVPLEGPYNKEALLSSLGVTRVEISEVIETLNLSETCTHPVLGELTRMELIYFVIYHTQRHIHQLKNIFQKVVNKESVIKQ